MYGRDVVLPSDISFGYKNKDNKDYGDARMNYKINLIERLKRSYEEIVLKREKAVNDYKFKYDSVHKNTEFKEGDLVMLYWPIPKKGFSQKLLPKWTGPFTVVKRIGAVTFRVRQGKKLLCVHVQRLRLYRPF